MSTAAEQALDELLAREDAQRRLDGWLDGAHAIALLKVAVSSGLFTLLRSPRTVGAIAVAGTLSAGQAEDLCCALEAYGVAERDPAGYRLSADFALLAAEGEGRSLDDVLSGEFARLLSLAMLTPAGRRVTGRSLSTAAQLAIARAQGPRPTPLTIAAAYDLADAIPEVGNLWHDGARHVELGCGTAGALLALLLAFPKLTALGVERSSRVLTEARRRANVAGVTQRIEWRRSDARGLREIAEFDTLFWSQPFFSTNTHCALLTVCWRVLRPGGYLLMPVLDEAPCTTSVLQTPAGRAASFDRVVFGARGARPSSHAQMVAKTEQAGFAIERLVPSVFGRLLVAHKPDAA